MYTQFRLCYYFPMKNQNFSPDKRKKRLLGAAASAFTAASIAIGALFSAPQEILSLDNGEDDAETQAAIVSVGKRLERSAGDTAKPRTGDRLRAFFLRQPAIVRGAVLLPMWCVGKAMITALSLLWTALAPMWQVVLGVLLNAALLVGLFLLVYKLLFPNRSLKTLFTKRNLLVLVIGSVALAATDAVLRALWPEYAPISIGIKIGAGLLVLTLICLRLFGKKAPKNAVPSPAAKAA